MALNVTTAVIGSGCNTATASPSLAQWDRGQILQIEGAELPETYKVEFSNGQTLSAIPAIGTAAGVEIPDALLYDSSPITAYIVLTDESSRDTEYWVTIYVTPRQIPEDVQPDPEQSGVIDQLIAQLNSGVERAEAAASMLENVDAAATTLQPGSPATAEYSDGVFEFGIPEGEKGDPFTYEDFTEEEKAELVQGPILDAQTDAVAAVGTARVSAVNDVNSAGVTQVGNVNSAGDSQVQAVQAKGTEVIGSIPSDYSDLTAEVSDLNNALNKKNDNDMIVEALNFESATIARYISPSTNKWAAATNASGWMFSIPDRCLFLRIKGGTNSTSLAFLKTNGTIQGTTPDYSDGETRRGVNSLTEYDLIVPNDAHYVYIQKSTSSGTDLTPNYAKKLIEPNIVIIDSTLTETGKAADAKVVGDYIREILQLSLSNTYTDGAYINYSTGATGNGENFAYTNYISVDGITEIMYSRIVVPSQYSPNHGIAFYDENKVFISGSGIKSLAKGNTSGYEQYTVSVPANAKYIRCTRWSESFEETYNTGEFYIYDTAVYNKTLESKVESLQNEFSPMAVLHAVPQSEGVQNAILTARQFTDIMWAPVADMPGIIYSNQTYNYKTHKKGCRQKGIPYGSGLNYNEMVGDTISFDTFATAVKSAGSVLYTNNVYVEGGKRACYYGVACSKLVQACWGAPELIDSQQITRLPGIVKIADAGDFTIDDVQLGDGVINPNVHCTIVTDILRSASTLEVVAVEISEAVTPTCRRLTWSRGEFEDHFASYGLYRYSYIDNAKYRKARYIDIDDGYDGVKDVPFAIRRGSFINILTTTSLSKKADIDNTKWTTLHDIVDGVDQTTQITSSAMDCPIDRTGYHEVYPTNENGEKGNSSYYFVYTLSVSGTVSDGNITVTYAITEGAKPWVIVFDNFNYTFVEEDAETITAEIPEGKTSCYVLFKSDYGTIKSQTITFA